MTPAEPLPVYPYWDKVPDHLLTATALGKAGLKPGGPPVARVEYTVYRKRRSYDLYDRTTAIQKRPLSEAQLAALEKARIAQRTCTRCQAVVEKPSDLSPRGRCAACLAELAAIKRAKEVDGTILWARRMLATPDALILDTETIDLHDYICEIGIIRMDGRVVFESLVNPRVKNRATHIHGITDQMCWNAPTFDEIELELRRMLHGKTVVVYNAAYDAAMLEAEIRRMCTPPDEAMLWLIDKDWSRSSWGDYQFDAWRRHDEYKRLVSEHAQWWRDRVDWQCAMEQYAVFYGDWHDYYRNYRYQPLRGGHRAVGDCLACLDVLKRMAATPLSTESPVPVLSGQALDEKLDADAYAMQMERDGRHPDDDPAQWQKVT